MAGELEERLRGPHRRSECDNFVEVHQDFLNQAADELTALTAKVALLTEALKGLDAPWIQFINCWADPSGNAAYDAKEEEGNVKVLADAMTAARAALDPKP